MSRRLDSIRKKVRRHVAHCECSKHYLTHREAKRIMKCTRCNTRIRPTGETVQLPQHTRQ